MADFGSTADGCWSTRDVDTRNSSCTHAAKGWPCSEKTGDVGCLQDKNQAASLRRLSIHYAHRSAKYRSHCMLKMKSDFAADLKHLTILPENLDSDPVHFLYSRDLKEPSR